MTSIHFQIDPSALRILHGDRAEGFQRRRERERREWRAGEARNRGLRGNDDSDDEPAPLMDGLNMYNNQMMRERDMQAALAARGGARESSANMRIAGAPATFISAGGRRLNLDNMGYEELVEAFPVIGPRGLGPEALDQCSNVYKFRCNLNATTSRESSCSICLATFEDGDEIRMLPCLHPYHKACADQWLANHTSCPICKTDIKTLVAEIPRITGKGHPNGVVPPLQRQAAQRNLDQAAGVRDSSREPPRNSAGAPDSNHFRNLAQNAIDSMRSVVSGRQQHISVASIDAVSRDPRLNRGQSTVAQDSRQSRSDAAAVQARRRAFQDVVREHEQAEEEARERRERDLRRREEGRERREAERVLSPEEERRRREEEEQRRRDQEAAIALSDEIDVYREIAEQHRRQFGPIRRNSEGNRQQPRALHQQDAPLSRASSVASIQSNANRPALSGPASLVRASSDTISSNAYRRADEVSPTERGSGLGAYPSGQRAPTLAPVRADLRSIREVESENDRDRERQRGRQGARERFGGRSPAVIAAAQIIETSPVLVSEGVTRAGNSENQSSSDSHRGSRDANRSATSAAAAMASMNTPVRRRSRIEVVHSPGAGSLFTSSPQRRNGDAQNRLQAVRFSLDGPAGGNSRALGLAATRPSSAEGTSIDAAVRAARSAPRRAGLERQVAWESENSCSHSTRHVDQSDIDLMRAIEASLRDVAAANTQAQQPLVPCPPPAPSNRPSNARPLPGVEIAAGRRTPPPDRNKTEMDSRSGRNGQGTQEDVRDDGARSNATTSEGTDEAGIAGVGYRLGHAGGQNRVAVRAEARRTSGSGEADQSSTDVSGRQPETPVQVRRALSDREKRALAAERRMALLAVQSS